MPFSNDARKGITDNKQLFKELGMAEFIAQYGNGERAMREHHEKLPPVMRVAIAEETGIVANNLRSVGSQCWPFPSQVMVGFVADYVEGEIQVDTTELADARWFPVDALPELPPKRSIARYILDTAMELP